MVPPALYRPCCGSTPVSLTTPFCPVGSFRLMPISPPVVGSVCTLYSLAVAAALLARMAAAATEADTVLEALLPDCAAYCDDRSGSYTQFPLASFLKTMFELPSRLTSPTLAGGLGAALAVGWLDDRPTTWLGLPSGFINQISFWLVWGLRMFW